MNDHPTFEALTDAAYGLAARPQVEPHARDCAECRSILEALAAERNVLQATLGGARMSFDAQERVLALVRRPTIRLVPLAAAALLVACFGLALHLASEVRALRDELAAQSARLAPPEMPGRMFVVRLTSDPDFERRALNVAWEASDEPDKRDTIAAAIRKPYYESLARYQDLWSGGRPEVDFVKFNPMQEVEGRVRPMLPPDRWRRFHSAMSDWQDERSREVALKMVEDAARKLELNDSQRDQLRSIVLERVNQCSWMAFAPPEVGMCGARITLSKDAGFLRQVREVLPAAKADQLEDLLAIPAGGK